jgi:hypothetical protein
MLLTLNQASSEFDNFYARHTSDGNPVTTNCSGIVDCRSSSSKSSTRAYGILRSSAPTVCAPAAAAPQCTERQGTLQRAALLRYAQASERNCRYTTHSRSMTRGDANRKRTAAPLHDTPTPKPEMSPCTNSLKRASCNGQRQHGAETAFPQTRQR